MHIVNIMFSYIAGGIEQAFVDYCEGLQGRGHQVTALTHPNAVVNAQLQAVGVRTISLRNFGKWDIFAIARLRKQLQELNPDIVIAHANRAFSLTRSAIKGQYPLVGIAQNYTTHLLVDADAAFATTHDLIASVIAHGVPEERMFHIPNMVRCHELPHRAGRQNPPVIGTMGRFVKKKGFDVYIDALKLLKDRGYNFKAILGGAGAEDNALKRKAEAAGLMDILSFPGWVEDKKAFYTGIDIFCLPSLHEPFGIVLLEAFIHGTPVIATDSEGPRDIIAPNFDALIVKIGSASELAAAMAKLLDDALLSDSLAANAFAKAKTTYSIERVAERIERALTTIHTRWHLTRESAVRAA